MSNTVIEVGNLPARETYAVLKSELQATLVDVRTVLEWNFVGVSDLSGFGKKTLFKEWQTYSSMDASLNFARELEAVLASRGIERSASVFFICRSLARSLSAARAMAERGFTQCINVVGGFEGPCDGLRHRGGVDGWKAASLPWVQN